MKIYTATEMKQLVTYAIENEPIKSIDLIERASKALYDEIIEICDNSHPIKVFAGPHNNGSDALAVSRMLEKSGYNVEVFLFNTTGILSQECEENRNKLISSCPKISFHEISSKFDLPNLTKNDLIIDGLFGIGLNQPLSNSFALLVKFINNSPATIVSIDIPSGLMCEDNTLTFSSQIIRANYTLSLQSVKLAFLMTDCQEYIGECKILDIGIESEKVPDKKTEYFLDEDAEMRQLLKKRNPFGNKGTFGHGLLIASSYGMAGAAVIAARSALSSGIGKLTIHTPSANNTIIQAIVPEAVVHHDEDKYRFTSPEHTENYTAMAIGPGLGCKQETATAFIEQISHCIIPLIIDADGLNILAEHKGWLQQIPKDTILTPHPKEFIRLFGHCKTDFDMLSQAKEQAIHQQIYIILKNHYTAICCPNGSIFYNTTGNSGMATAGTGDALVGILLSLLSQGYLPEDACRLGCYLHGLAGDLAAEELSEEGMTAMDLVHHLPYAIKQLKNSQL